MRTVIFALLVGLIFGGCAEVAVVDSGHRAVVLSADGQLSTLDEGVSAIPDDAVVDDFDLRQQTAGGTFTAITQDGVPIVVSNPSIAYSWIAQELVEADRSLGQQNAQAVVTAVVASIISRVLATYRWDELESAKIREAQDKITSLAEAALKPRHLLLGSVELKGLTPKLPLLAQAVTATSVWQQRSAAAQSQVELAKQRAESLRTAAAGIAEANANVAPTLTPGVLVDKSQAAWRALLAAPTTQVEVTGQSKPALEVSP